MKSIYLMVIGLLLFTGTVDAQEQEQKSPVRMVSVRGYGTVAATPDQLRLSVQIGTRGESASAAMTEASKRTASVLVLLKGYGVEEKDIQTSRVSVSPIYDYEKRIQPPPIIGYNGSNEFTVLFRGKLMDNVGDFLDKAVKAGASNFGSLMFESSRQREIERDALKKAAADAKERAQVLAKELGATLGNVISISESSMGPAPVTYMMKSGAMDATSAAPVATGELSISAQAQVSFELK